MSLPETWHAIVRGRVQGVYFRESTVQQARALAVSGWVRNRRDGSVEVLMQGAPPAVAALREWLRHGPPAARVDALVVAPWSDPTPIEGFERRPTD